MKKVHATYMLKLLLNEYWTNKEITVFGDEMQDLPMFDETRILNFNITVTGRLIESYSYGSNICVKLKKSDGKIININVLNFMIDE